MAIKAGRVRQRVNPIGKNGTFQVGTVEKRSNLNGSWTPDAPTPVATPQHNWVSFVRTGDENHGRPPYKMGGPFFQVRVTSSFPPYGEVIGAVDIQSQNKLRRYKGGFKAPADSDFGQMPGFSTPTSPRATIEGALTDLTAVASEAWTRTKPKIQNANVATGLFEAVRETPKLLKDTALSLRDKWIAMGGDQKTAVMRPKWVANDFLGTTFGWLPLLSDIRDVLNTYENGNRIIQRLTADNGRSIRKRRLLRESTSEQVIRQGEGEIMLARSLFAAGADNFYSPGRKAYYEVIERLTTRTWAVGRFRYFREEFDLSNPKYHSRLMRVRRQLTIYGARISPENIYNVIPWTWLGDWVTNAGSYVERLSDYLTDSLAAEYFYVMHSVKRERVFRNTFPFALGNEVVVEATRVVETKQRIEATSPYGFDVTWEDIGNSPKKQAIIAALGISRKGFYR